MSFFRPMSQSTSQARPRRIWTSAGGQRNRFRGVHVYHPATAPPPTGRLRSVLAGAQQSSHSAISANESLPGLRSADNCWVSEGAGDDNVGQVCESRCKEPSDWDESQKMPHSVVPESNLVCCTTMAIICALCSSAQAEETARCCPGKRGSAPLAHCVLYMQCILQQG
jgi:hypothetical protein